MVELATVGHVGSRVLEQLGLLERVKDRLINNPERAARYLAQALSELERAVKILRDVCLDVSNLSLRTPDDVKRTMRYLRNAKTGAFKVEVKRAHNHCRAIRRIYERHLRGWFSRALTPGQANKLDMLFAQMSIVDGDLVQTLEVLANELGAMADEVAIELGNKRGGKMKARQRLKKATKNLDPLLATANEKLGELVRLQGEFGSAARVHGYR